MKPYSGEMTLEERIFSYRLSRARRIIENCFGILRARFRIFRQPIKAAIETVEVIVLVACALHNYLRLTENAAYCPAGFVDCETRSGEIKHGKWRTVVAGDSSAL